MSGIKPSATIAREGRATSFERLKPGPGKSPEHVGASQRDRIHRAMIELAADEGYEHVTVRALTQKAGVSTRTFYRHFANREECLALSVDRTGHEILRRAARRKAEVAQWEPRLRLALCSLLKDLADAPKVARVLLVEAPCSGRPVRAQAARLTTDLERLFSYLLAGGPTAPRRLVVGIAAGVVRVATMTTLTGRAQRLSSFAPQLADWALDLYGRCGVADRPETEERRTRGNGRPEPSIFELSVGDGHGERERIISAASRVVVATGFAGLSTSRIRREAGVSRRSFDQRFGDVTTCFLAAIESLAASAADKAITWAAADGGTSKFNYRTVLALCAIVARNQPQARLIFDTILAPGRDGLRCRERLISEAAAWLLSESQSSPLRSPIVAEASVAATWRLAQREVLGGRADGLPRRAALLFSLLS